MLDLIEHTYSEIEGLTGAAYVTAAKKEIKAQSKQKRMDQHSIQESYKERIAYLSERKKIFLSNSKEFLEICKINDNNPISIYNYIIQNKELRSKHRLLMGDPISIVKRAILEASNYINAYQQDEKIRELDG